MGIDYCDNCKEMQSKIDDLILDRNAVQEVNNLLRFELNEGDYGIIQELLRSMRECFFCEGVSLSHPLRKRCLFCNTVIGVFERTRYGKLN